MKISRTLVSIIVFAIAALPALAQNPQFTGSWKLNVAKSFMAGDHPAKDYKLTKVFVQKADSIEQTDIAGHVSMMNIPLPDSKTTMELLVDGKEHDVVPTSSIPDVPPSKIKVSAEWQGGTLFIIETGETYAGLSTTQRRYYLSEDGSQLVELLESHNVYGDTQQRLVFDKLP
jgi:hypothetical protein